MSTSEGINYFSIGDRLSDERKKLGLSQDALATQLCVTRLTQRNYEAGKTFPDAKYLSMFEQLGADIFYIVTGRHQVVGLTSEEEALVAGYRSMDQALREGVLRMVLGTGKPKELKGTVVKGDVGQVVEGDATFQQPVNFTVGGKKKAKP